MLGLAGVGESRMGTECVAAEALLAVAEPRVTGQRRLQPASRPRLEDAMTLLAPANHLVRHRHLAGGQPCAVVHPDRRNDDESHRQGKPPSREPAASRAERA